ncbi:MULTISPECIES: ABC transporter permease [unclassified Bradyrhizobium]|uniref:ABC transporter permease n=1 Tax=unclassified Bradyrhizobium TaxID=2631580 RepID=UPI00244D566C|nr:MULTISPECIES: ABC transporter permease [unclassified Bradyrhizobium]MDH2343592.1 ABC transporter permease [Bradyrhizobium sp. SSUT77]MDH2352308.1 ABC transporter permease [Bradyrhizobium sp. SSUT112]
MTSARNMASNLVAPPDLTKQKRGSSLRGRPIILLNILGVFAFCITWALVTERGWVSPLFLPSPFKVASEAAGVAATHELWWAIGASSLRVFLGFALAAAIAIPLGVLMGSWWPAKALLDPLISLLRPLPSITWIPLTMLWLGIGEAQKVAIVFMGSWIYVLLYTLESTKRVDPILIKAARNLGASEFAVMREVVLPGALPGILSGLKVSLAIAWSCVLSAEMVAAQNGLGALIWSAKDWGNLALVLVGMVSISATVLVADLLANRLERALLPWERHKRQS